MLSAVFAGTSVIATLGGLIAAARYARTKWGLSAEWSRKCVHIGMGAACSTFPWLFLNAAPVFVLAGIASALMIAIRAVPGLRATFGCALNGVGRDSWGEFTFIAGVACSFALAHGEIAAYLIPLSILTFADSLAALVGQRFGTIAFASPSGTKTFEGSAAFFVVAFACTATVLIVVHEPYPLPAGFAAAVVLTLVEALSWKGFDNVAVPIVGVLLLRLLAVGSVPAIAS